jgi:hypothetical protein
MVERTGSLAHLRDPYSGCAGTETRTARTGVPSRSVTWPRKQFETSVLARYVTCPGRHSQGIRQDGMVVVVQVNGLRLAVALARRRLGALRLDNAHVRGRKVRKVVAHNQRLEPVDHEHVWNKVNDREGMRPARLSDGQVEYTEALEPSCGIPGMGTTRTACGAIELPVTRRLTKRQHRWFPPPERAVAWSMPTAISS